MMRFCPLIPLGALFAFLTLGTIVGTAARAYDPFEEATVHIMAGDYESALAQYESFLSAHPRDRLSPVAAMAAANIQHLALDDAESAMRSYERVLSDYRKSPWATEAARRMADCLAAREEWARAGEVYQEALELAAREGAEAPAAVIEGGSASGAGAAATVAWISEVSLAAADCFYRLGDRQKVIQTYERVLQGSVPPDAAAATLWHLGDCYESGGEPEKAAERYARVIEEYPISPEFASAMAKRELIEAHRKLDWAAYEAFAQAGGAHTRGEFAEAIARCEEVLKGGGSKTLHKSAEYRKIVAETVLEGDATEGSRRLRTLLSDSPKIRGSARVAQTVSYISRVAALETEARRNPDDAAALRNLGRTYLRGRSTSRALELLERAAALAPDDEETSLYLGYAYASAGRDEEATKAFEAYLEHNPDNTDALNTIGYTYLNQDSPEKAIVYFKRYAELAPEEANAHDSLGEGYLRAGNLEEAVREYEKAIELNPSFSNSHFMLGTIYQQLEDAGKSSAAYRRFLELSSSGPQADRARAALEEMSAN